MGIEEMREWFVFIPYYGSQQGHYDNQKSKQAGLEPASFSLSLTSDQMRALRSRSHIELLL